MSTKQVLKLFWVKIVLKFCGIIFATICIGANIPNSHANVVLADDFDSDTAGNAPSNWVVQSSALVSSAESVSSPNSLATSNAGGAYRNLSSPISLTSTQQYQVSLDLMIGPLAGEHSLTRFLIANDLPNNYGALGSIWLYNETLFVRSGNSLSGDIPVGAGTYSVNTWYHVVFTFTPANGYFDVVVTQGETEIGSVYNVSFDLGSNPNLDANPVFDTVWISNQFSTGSTTSYLDNVVVQTVPEPSSVTLAMLAGAGSVLYLFRRRHA